MGAEVEGLDSSGDSVVVVRRVVVLGRDRGGRPAVLRVGIRSRLGFRVVIGGSVVDVVVVLGVVVVVVVVEDAAASRASSAASASSSSVFKYSS